MEKLHRLIVKYEAVLSYLFFGGLTTLVNFLIYFPLYNWLHFSGAISNVLAWMVAVVFAYLTNKPFVFKSHDWSRKTLIPEFTKFVACRVGSGLLETVSIFLFVDLLLWNGNWVKVVVSVLVVVLNYISSRWLVFKKQ